MVIILLYPVACYGELLAGVPRGCSIPLAAGGVVTPLAARGPHKIEKFVGFIIDNHYW